MVFAAHMCVGIIRHRYERQAPGYIHPGGAEHKTIYLGSQHLLFVSEKKWSILVTVYADAYSSTGK